MAYGREARLRLPPARTGMRYTAQVAHPAHLARSDTLRRRGEGGGRDCIFGWRPRTANASTGERSRWLRYMWPRADNPSRGGRRLPTRRNDPESWDARTRRNPMLLFALSGWLLLRYAARAFSASLFHDPPRRRSRPSPGASRQLGDAPRRQGSACSNAKAPADVTHDDPCAARLQPPSNLPISASFVAACSYWPVVIRARSWLRRR